METKIKVGIWIGNNLKLNNNGAKNYFDSAYEIFKNIDSKDVIIKFISDKKIINSNNVIFYNPKIGFLIHDFFVYLSNHWESYRVASFIRSIATDRQEMLEAEQDSQRKEQAAKQAAAKFEGLKRLSRERKQRK